MGPQHATFDGAPHSPLAAHLHLRSTVHLQHRLGHITQKVIVTVTVWGTGKLAGNRLDEGILLIRHPPPHRLVQALSPLPGHDDQPAYLWRRTREQGLSKPYPLTHELAHHIQRFMALFRLH